jgi:hypothetical protein
MGDSTLAPFQSVMYRDSTQTPSPRVTENSHLIPGSFCTCQSRWSPAHPPMLLLPSYSTL